MSQNLQIIPTDIFDAWAKGEYYVGDIPSISYTRLGTALYLRSWYTYVNESDDPNNLAGVAKVDIRGSFLFLGGVRLRDQVRGQHPRRRAVFWRTEASHFVSDDEILWFHAMYNRDVEAEVLKKYLPEWWLKDDVPTPATDQFGLTPQEWNTLLRSLRTEFDSDVERLQQECSGESIDHGMLRFGINGGGGGGHRCEYYQFYSAGPDRDLLKGVSRFTRAFLL